VPLPRKLEATLDPIRSLNAGIVQGAARYIYATNCLVEVSTNLTQWELLTNLTTVNASVQFSDPSAANYTQRFYRLHFPSLAAPTNAPPPEMALALIPAGKVQLGDFFQDWVFGSAIASLQLDVFAFPHSPVPIRPTTNHRPRTPPLAPLCWH
jgi:hypothetical protein